MSLKEYFEKKTNELYSIKRLSEANHYLIDLFEKISSLNFVEESELEYAQNFLRITLDHLLVNLNKFEEDIEGTLTRSKLSYEFLKLHFDHNISYLYFIFRYKLLVHSLKQNNLDLSALSEFIASILPKPSFLFSVDLKRFYDLLSESNNYLEKIISDKSQTHSKKVIIDLYFCDLYKNIKIGLALVKNMIGISHDLSIVLEELGNEIDFYKKSKIAYKNRMLIKENNYLSFSELLKDNINFRTILFHLMQCSYTYSNYWYIFDYYDYKIHLRIYANPLQYIDYCNAEIEEEFIKDPLLFVYKHYANIKKPFSSYNIKVAESYKKMYEGMSEYEDLRYVLISKPYDKYVDFINKIYKNIEGYILELAENDNLKKQLMILIAYELYVKFSGQDIDIIKLIEEFLLLIFGSRRIKK